MSKLIPGRRRPVAAFASSLASGRRQLLTPCAITVLVAMASASASATEPRPDWAFPAPPEAPMCGGETMPEPTPAYPLPTLFCAADFGIAPDADASADTSTTDHGPALRAALDALRLRATEGALPRAHLFLPSGRYRFTGELVLPGGTGLVGSPSGRTRLVSKDAESGVLRTRRDDDTGVLIEGLQLENTRIVLETMAASTVRGNGLSRTRASTAQITVVRGGHTIDGNVLWRSSDTPAGLGIDVGLWEARPVDSSMPALAAPEVVIKRNLIGAVDTTELRGYGRGPRSAPAVAGRMVGSDGATSVAQGHYRSAIRSMIPVPLRIHDNVIVVQAPPTGAAATSDASDASATSPTARTPRRSIAVFHSPRSLKIFNNAFGSREFAKANLAPLRLVAPSDTVIESNYFNSVPVVLDGGATAAKRNRIFDNTFTSSPVSVNVAVNGSGTDHMAPEDVTIRLNLFYTSTACPIRLRPPQVGSQNFPIDGSRRYSAARRTTVPVKICP